MNKYFLSGKILLLLYLSACPVITAQTRAYLDSLYNEFVGIQSSGIKKPLNQLTVKRPGNKCGFSIVGEIKAHLNLFTADQRKTLNKLLARPVTEKSLISHTGKFRIHYNTTGDSLPNYDPSLNPEDNARIVADAADSAYSFEVEYLNYPPPPGDNGKGGDDLYDIYIINLAYGDYGYTQDESFIAGNTFDSFIKIDNNFDGCYTKGVNACNVAMAHELFHAIQMGNYFYDNLLYKYFYEMTATAMEEFTFDNINDYYQFHNYFHEPSRPFYDYSGNDAYGLAVWWIYLREKFGFDILKKQWELVRNNNPLKATELSLQEYNTSFRDELNEFGVWSYYTGSRYSQNVGTKFSEGEFYETLWIPSQPIELTKPDISFQTSIKPLSNKFYFFVSKMTAGYNDTVISIITNGDVESAIYNPDSYIPFQYILSNSRFDGSKQISDQLFSKIVSDKPASFKDADIINNEIHTYMEEIDYAFPVPFVYDDKEHLIYLPVVYNNGFNFAGVKIFSVSMNLVYAGNKEISKKNDKFIVTWNGLDSHNNKLSTGVYIFVTESDGKLKTGKLVIENE